MRRTRGGGSTSLGFGLAVAIVFVYYIVMTIFSYHRRSVRDVRAGLGVDAEPSFHRDRRCRVCVRRRRYRNRAVTFVEIVRGSATSFSL